MNTFAPAPSHRRSHQAPRRWSISRIIAITLWLTPLSGIAQVIISETYTQNFDSLGAGLPAGWAVWTSSQSDGNGTSFSWVSTELSNNAGFSATSAFRNIPGSSQNWTPSLSSGSDRALGWRAGSAASREGSITFTLENTAGYALNELSFQLFTPNSTGASAPIEMMYQIGTGGEFQSFSPKVTYSTDLAQAPLTVTWLMLSAAQLAPLRDQSSPVTFSFRNTYGPGVTEFDTVALDNFSYSASAIPEPSSYALLCASVVLLGSAIMRRRKRGSTLNSQGAECDQSSP